MTQATISPDEQRVLSAIDGGYRTFLGLVLQLGIPMNDLDLLLAGMVSDRLIRKESKGDLDAYFRFEQRPVKFWRSGGGRVDAEFDTDFVPRDETAKAEEMSKFYIKSDGEQEAARSSQTPSTFAQNGASSEVEKEATTRSHYKKKAPVDKTLLEQFASTESNAKLVAEKLGMSQAHMYKEFHRDPDVRKAFDRGRRKYATSQGYTVEELGGRPRNGKQAAKGIDPPSTRDRSRDSPEPETAAKPMNSEISLGKTGDSLTDNQAAKDALVIELKFLGPDGKPIVLYELAEALGFNVGNALLHIAADEVEAAIWYLEREKTRRESLAA